MIDRRIGAQYYTVRDFCKTKEDFDQTCKKVSEIGYKTVQLSGLGDISAADVKEVIDKYSLLPVLTHRPSAEFEENLGNLIDYHKTIGCKAAGLGAIPLDGAVSEDVLGAFLKKYNAIAEELEKHGIVFAYHNHTVEFGKIKGKHILDIIAENTHTNFKLTLDVYWVAFSGMNPVKCLEKYKNKIECIHFKDLGVDTNEGKMVNPIVMRPISEGNLDWDEIIAASDESGAKWAQVEQDKCYGENPFDCMKRSYEFLKTKGFC